MPSGPELSKTRLMILPRVRGRFCLERERDLEERILSFDPENLGLAPCAALLGDANSAEVRW